VDCIWQGGEPSLAGLDFFHKVVDLQKRHAQGRTIFNCLQTNGLRIDDQWCEFLGKNRWLVGVSIDGPASLHNAYRVDKRGKDTHDRVVTSIQRMQEHQIEVNALTVLHRYNAKQPRIVYDFLCDLGLTHMQFIPYVDHESVVSPLPVSDANGT
jgi:uncharacterized protein